MDKQDFANIMDIAIAAEVEAFTFYRDVAAKVSDPEMKRLFQEFANEEQGHGKMLEKIKEHEAQSFTFAGGLDYKISEMTPLPLLAMEMKPVNAISLAMKKEEEAMNNYTQLASATDDPEKKKIFSELAKMEQGHKARMEGLYTDTAFPETW
jgi:rubrerythrin